MTQFVFTVGDVTRPDKQYIHSTLSRYHIGELNVPPSDDTNTGCTEHDAYVRNLHSQTCILVMLSAESATYVLESYKGNSLPTEKFGQLLLLAFCFFQFNV